LNDIPFLLSLLHQGVGRALVTIICFFLYVDAISDECFFENPFMFLREMYGVYIEIYDTYVQSFMPFCHLTDPAAAHIRPSAFMAFSS